MKAVIDVLERSNNCRTQFAQAAQERDVELCFITHLSQKRSALYCKWQQHIFNQVTCFIIKGLPSMDNFNTSTSIL